ncbi:MAG: serine/threonine protein kinase [Planctomycetes bacterium]|nr:serine/threonine protein kinase [Planctomycetota bacterium]
MPAQPREEERVPAAIGPYRVVERIGSGGMGVVYRCEDPALKRFCAVKVLRSKFSGDPHYEERFRREAQTIASLSHPAVAHVYGIGETFEDGERLLYIVMEHVDGPSIERMLEAEKRLPAPRALALARETALGLKAAQAKGIVHRDIKPSNLLVSSSGALKIVDFGLAKELSGKNSLTDEGIVLGTPHYLSPEQGRGKPVDHRSDIYSLGATLYHMLTGRPPFEGTSQVSVIVAHVNEEPRAPHEVAAGLLPDLSRLVLRMLAKAPEARHGSYDELIADLEAAARGEPPARSAVGRAEMEIPEPGPAGARGHRRSRRSRLLAWAAAAAVLLSGGLVAALLSIPPPPIDAETRKAFGGWYRELEGGRVLLDMDYASPPGRDPLLVLHEPLQEEGRPRLEKDLLRWTSFEEPFACGLRFDRIEEIQVWLGPTTGSFDLGIALADPAGSQRRFLLFRLRPGEVTPEPLLAMRSSERAWYSAGTPLPPVPRLGQGPFAIFLELRPSGSSTVLSARIDRKDGARVYQGACELEETDWASGILVLETRSCMKPFSVSLQRVRMSGVLARAAGVEEVPWRS